MKLDIELWLYPSGIWLALRKQHSSGNLYNDDSHTMNVIKRDSLKSLYKLGFHGKDCINTNFTKLCMSLAMANIRMQFYKRRRN